jgi:hypothetical protein
MGNLTLRCTPLGLLIVANGAAALGLAMLLVGRWRIAIALLTLWFTLILVSLLISLVGRPRSPAGERCPRCGYDLRGLPAGAICPECGHDAVALIVHGKLPIWHHSLTAWIGIPTFAVVGFTAVHAAMSDTPPTVWHALVPVGALSASGIVATVTVLLRTRTNKRVTVTIANATWLWQLSYAVLGFIFLISTFIAIMAWGTTSFWTCIVVAAASIALLFLLNRLIGGARGR